MVRPSMRSRTRARIRVRTPGGKTVIHVRLRRKGRARCAVCGGELRGVPVFSSYRMRAFSLSEKRPNRFFGGVLCHRCLSSFIKLEVRREAMAAS
ncbi:MAG: hypothetical protein QW039_04140 [Fervidicoccaceae archaeon]